MTIHFTCVVFLVVTAAHDKTIYPKNLADPKINKLNVHGMCWPNLGPTSFPGPLEGGRRPWYGWLLKPRIVVFE